ncbi:MAG: beta-hexosaminidase [Bacilli bacterium]|nr:beta-hexosaminidase [Bacilli bacterium]
MKKLLVLIILLALAIFGSQFVKNNNSNSIMENNKEEDVVVFPEEETDDIFNEYYNDAAKLMKDMTLEEKIGQLFLVRYDVNTSTKQIKNYYAGGFVLFAKDFQNHTKETITKELKDRQSVSKIPLALAVDEEGGYVTRVSRFPAFRSEKFKSNRVLFETGGYDLVKTSEKEKAELLLSLGLNLNLGPVADVSTDVNDFINIRTFGRDAKETSMFISNIVSYNNESLISSCLKHFPGYGNNVDTHNGIAIDNRNYDNFVNNDYLPFKSGIEAGVPTILVSHNIVNSMDSEYPASLSKKVISELRDKLNFSGVVITDDLAMGAVAKFVDANNAATLAINAGNDMIITSSFETMFNEVLNNVKSGIIKEEVIDMAVKRILAWKYAYKIIK